MWSQLSSWWWDWHACQIHATRDYRKPFVVQAKVWVYKKPGHEFHELFSCNSWLAFSC